MDENNALNELNTWDGVNKYIAKKARNALKEKKPVPVEVKKEEKVEVKTIPNVDEEFLKSMSKAELDRYAEKEFKINLDRRKSKNDMIEDLLKLLEGDF